MQYQPTYNLYHHKKRINYRSTLEQLLLNYHLQQKGRAKTYSITLVGGRKDLNVHELCFAIDSACTELARNDILLLWGVFTGKPITLAACGSKRGVSPSCIRQRQEMVVRNTGHGSRRIIMEPKSDDE